MSALDAQTMFIAWSAPPEVYSKDVNYQYRQDSNLLYLTGVDQEGAVLVLMPGNDKAREVLFIREPEPRREQWTGHMLTKEEARALTGIETVYWTSQFEPFVTAMFNRAPFGLLSRSKETHEYDRFFDAVRQSRAKLALLFGRRPAPSFPRSSSETAGNGRPAPTCPTPAMRRPRAPSASTTASS